jgi:hypothetical protein
MEHDEDVMEMNEIRPRASGRVQRATPKVAAMIDGSGHPTGHPVIHRRRKIMLKTISAALLAASVIAAPALAAGQAKTAQAPVTKAEQVEKAKPSALNANAKKPSALNANAKMSRHHVRPVSHHRSHKHMGALKTHNFSKASIKHAGHATKRG